MSNPLHALIITAVAVALLGLVEVSRFALVWWRDRGPEVRARFRYERCRHDWVESWQGPSHARQLHLICRHCGSPRR